VEFVTPLGWRSKWGEVNRVPRSWNFLGDTDPESEPDIEEFDDQQLANADNDVHMADED
jgi:hypothetical protein